MTRRQRKETRWHDRDIDDAAQFVRRLRLALAGPDVRVVWFIGAGCSISSGIPGAGELVTSWLRQLCEIKTGDAGGWEAYASSAYPDWRTAPAKYYGRVIDDLFEWEEDRQREIEKLTGGKDPGFGYATLAQLMSHEGVGHKVNVAITVNFDDLIADSLYLYTAKKPLAIGHELLAGFIRRGDYTPLIVKVHGDAHLAPKNTVEETADLDADLVRAVQRTYARARVVMMGYAGADESIARMFRTEQGETGPEAIYWVNERPPEAPLRESFELTPDRVSWVHHLDFDALMVELHTCFDLGRPDFDRLSKLSDAYESSLRRLLPGEAQPDSAAGSRVPVVEGLLDELQGWRLALEADLIRKSNPEEADKLFQQALRLDPQNADFLGYYAAFLAELPDETERALEAFERAIALDPNHAVNLGNYALFLSMTGGHPGVIEDLFKKALEIDPKRENNWVLYAGFLRDREDFSRAKEAYLQALAAGPTKGDNFGRYANFLLETEGVTDTVGEMYRRAIELNPTALNLGNYAGYLYLRGEDDAARDYVKRARENLDPEEHTPLELEFGFYRLCYDLPAIEEAAEQVRKLLIEGVRSPGFDLSHHVARARAIGHLHIDIVEAASKVISEKAPLQEFLDAMDRLQ